MTTTAESDTAPETKPRGRCTGCAFDYQLGTARSGEHKGALVIRKHNSRTGPGLCDGAQKPPKEPESGCTLGAGHEGLCDGQPCEEVVTHVDIGLDYPAVPPVTISEVHAENPPRQPDPFTGPAPASDIPEDDTTVSGQPDPDRDRWGRYVLHGQAHTRATTFAKLGSNTKAIEQWGHRNVVVGLVRRPDLLALAHGLEVKRDKSELNSIVDQAKDAAGQKVAANLGTAYHAFSERLDACLISLSDVPEAYRGRVAQYAGALTQYGLKTRPEWIERTTAVRADQVSAPLPVAGMLDRIFELPDGTLCIGDLKTGSDLSYGMAEIEVQLALYAHGVNTHGLFDWNTKTWQPLTQSVDLPAPIRTDFAIVMHLPADGDGCRMLKVDIERGWRAAQLRGRLQSDQKEKREAQVLQLSDITAPVQAASVDVWSAPHMAQARQHFLAADSKARLAELYGYAAGSGKFSQPELELLASVGTKRLRDLGLSS